MKPKTFRLSMADFKRNIPQAKYKVFNVAPKKISVDNIIENCIDSIYRNKIMSPPRGTYNGVDRQETTIPEVVDGFKYVSVSFPVISAWVVGRDFTYRVVWWHENLGEGYILENANGSMTFFPNNGEATEDFMREEWLVDNSLDDALEYDDDYSEEENDEDEE